MPRPFQRGDIVLTNFPYSSISRSAVRPALVVSHGAIGQDLILVGISSVIRGASSPSDCLVELIHPNFLKQDFGFLR